MCVPFSWGFLRLDEKAEFKWPAYSCLLSGLGPSSTFVFPCHSDFWENLICFVFLATWIFVLGHSVAFNVLASAMSFPFGLSQWQRAMTVRKILQEIIEKHPRFHNITPLKTKHVVHWCRCHGYTPPDPETLRNDEDSIEDVLTQIDSEPGEYGGTESSFLPKTLFIKWLKTVHTHTCAASLEKGILTFFVFEVDWIWSNRSWRS